VIMAEADFSKPQLTDGYPEVLEEIRTNAEAQAALFDDVTPLNTRVGAKRWSTANVRWEKFDGSSWLELAAQYAINVQKLQGLLPGNADGNIPVSNGTLNTNLNCELLNGQTITYFATAQALTDLAMKEQSDIDAVNARIDGVTTDVSGKVSKAGDTMGGNLNMARAGGGTAAYSAALRFETDATAPFLLAVSGTLSFYDSTGNISNFSVTEGGAASVRGPVNTPQIYSNADYNAAQPNSGVFCSLGNIGGAFVDWDKTRPYALQISAADPGASYGAVRWTRWGGRHLCAIDGYEGGSGGGNPVIVFHVAATPNAWSFNEFDINRGKGGYVWGSWNFDPTAKIGPAVCNWNTGVGEWGPMSPGGDWSARLDVPAPYVMCGLYCSYSNGDLTTAGTFVRGVQLRNY